METFLFLFTCLSVATIGGVIRFHFRHSSSETAFAQRAGSLIVVVSLGAAVLYLLFHT